MFASALLHAAPRLPKCVWGASSKTSRSICRSLKASLGWELSSAVSCVWALIICHKTPTATYLRRQISHASLASTMSLHGKLACVGSFSDFGGDYLQSHHITKLVLPLSRKKLHVSNGGFVSVRALIFIGLGVLCSQRRRCCTVCHL